MIGSLIIFEDDGIISGTVSCYADEYPTRMCIKMTDKIRHGSFYERGPRCDRDPGGGPDGSWIVWDDHYKTLIERPK